MISKHGKEGRVCKKDSIIFYFFVLIINNASTFCINAQGIFHFGKIIFKRFRCKSGGAGDIKLLVTPLPV